MCAMEILLPENDAIKPTTHRNPEWTKKPPTYEKAPASLHQNILVEAQNRIEECSMAELFELFAAEITKLWKRQISMPVKQTMNFKFQRGIVLYWIPQIDMYWEQATATKNSLASTVMSHTKFKTIKYLHFNDNESVVQDQYNKVQCLHDLNKTLQQFGIFSHQLTIDEQMVRYFGCHGCKYMKGKPVKFGHKL